VIGVRARTPASIHPIVRGVSSDEGDGLLALLRRPLTQRLQEKARVLLKGLAPKRGDPQVRDGLAPAEGLLDGHESRGLQPSRVGCEITVGEMGLFPQAHEIEARLGGQRGEDAQATGAGDQAVGKSWRHLRDIIGTATEDA
jgi:hypothetical protein